VAGQVHPGHPQHANGKPAAHGGVQSGQAAAKGEVAGDVHGMCVAGRAVRLPESPSPAQV